MKRVAFVLFILLTTRFGFAQPQGFGQQWLWQYSQGTSIGLDAVELPSGNIMMLGAYLHQWNSPDSSMIALFTPDGTCLSVQTLDTLQGYDPVGIVLNPDNHPVILAERQNSDDLDIIDIALCEVSDSGSVTACARISEIPLWSVTSFAAAGNDFLLCGRSPSDASFAFELKTIKISLTNGIHVEWDRAILTSPRISFNQGSNLLRASRNGFVAVGEEIQFHGLTESWGLLLARLSVSGDTLWTRCLLDSVHIYVTIAVRETPDFGFIVLGERTHDYGILGVITVLRYDSSGNLQWRRDYCDLNYEDTHPGGIVSHDGGWLITGSTNSHNDSDEDDWYYIQINDQGDSLWSVIDSAQGLAHVETVQELANGDFLSVGCDGRVGSSNYGAVVCRISAGTSATDQRGIGRPWIFRLSCYPNPFNPSTMIEFNLTVPGKTTVSVFDITGRQVTTLIDQTLSAGSHSVIFDGSNLPSGIYLARLESGNTSLTHKLILLK